MVLRSVSAAAIIGAGEGFTTGSSIAQPATRKIAAASTRKAFVMREKYRKSDLEAARRPRQSRRHAIHRQPALAAVDVLVAHRQGAARLRHGRPRRGGRARE